MSFSISSCVLLLSCLLVTISADSLYGDAKVFLFKDASARSSKSPLFQPKVLLFASGWEKILSCDFNFFLLSQNALTQRITKRKTFLKIFGVSVGRLSANPCNSLFSYVYFPRSGSYSFPMMELVLLPLVSPLSTQCLKFWNKTVS
uniref:Secreted protein n=1 Tax=Cacopsylla melanoneura TaxID=428564 RepID=A0A8D9DUY0_9HEMI